ncbi:hypothetical protein [Glycomyces tenuis]|uniref:hypothetical protein n=1 Tax=Glycomyces tenuis TaxID=58116 RepID=UPI00200AEF20|nr:hypothetical protein [Glycomyces tenuis]
MAVVGSPTDHRCRDGQDRVAAIEVGLDRLQVSGVEQVAQALQIRFGRTGVRGSCDLHEQVIDRPRTLGQAWLRSREQHLTLPDRDDSAPELGEFCGGEVLESVDGAGEEMPGFRCFGRG